MSALAPTLQAFFTDRLARQRQASPHTIAAYRDTWKLLLAFASQRTGKRPTDLLITDLDAPLIGDFLDHLEHDRGNSPRTRNARLAVDQLPVLLRGPAPPRGRRRDPAGCAIPPKRYDQTIITYLTEPEISAARSSRPGHLDRQARPRPARPGHPDRPASIGTDFPHHQRHPPGLRRPYQLPGQRPQAADHPADRQHHRHPHRMARRTRRPARRPAIPHPPGTPLSRDALERRNITKHAATATRSCPALAEEHRRTSCATQRQCACSTPALTPPSSPCGSAMPASRPPRYTSTPTSRSKNAPSPGPNPATPSPAATSPPTTSSPSSRLSDYADLKTLYQATISHNTQPIGITARSRIRRAARAARPRHLPAQTRRPLHLHGQGQPARPAPPVPGPCPGKTSRPATARPDAVTAGSRNAPSRRSPSPPGCSSPTPPRPSRSPAGPAASTGRNGAPRPATRSPRCPRPRPGRPSSRNGSEATGKSRTSCTGSATLPSARTSPRHAPAPGPTSWPRSGTWSSTSCAWPAMSASPARSGTPRGTPNARSGCSQTQVTVSNRTTQWPCPQRLLPFQVRYRP